MIFFSFAYISACFDVYNIETALPVIDLETIENHLKLVKEDERRVSKTICTIRTRQRTLARAL